ncbi:MAG: hypothetical protein D3908_03935 [Candidatus Electrothrix sp. AUS4]|nr:hypothetical protein [Candidatus Electrothrix sp. AUS4]
MALEVLTFVKSSWIKPLWKQLGRITGERKKELDRLRDEFVDPEQLRGLYIEPFLQDRNPADVQQDDLLSAARQLAFERINEFFQGSLPLEKDGRKEQRYHIITRVARIIPSCFIFSSAFPLLSSPTGGDTHREDNHENTLSQNR